MAGSGGEAREGYPHAIVGKLDDTSFAIHILAAPMAAEIEKIRSAATNICADLRSERRNALLAEIVAGGSISTEAPALELRSEAIAQWLQLPSDRINSSNLSIVAPWRIRRRGMETRFILGDDTGELDQNFASKIGLAMRWFEEVKAGVSIKAISDREGLSSGRLTRMLRLAWLDPFLVEAVVSRRQPERLTVDAIFKSPQIAHWPDQRAWADGL